MKGMWPCEEPGKDDTGKDCTVLYFSAISVLTVEEFEHQVLVKTHRTC